MTHQCVINMLSFPLSWICCRPGPAMRASRDWAYVSVMCGADASWGMRESRKAGAGILERSEER
jgi:hypothetical protein